MKINQVHVSKFRNLQNLNITFEEELPLQVFPISSENGGGKSTLLQLIFSLFHFTFKHNRTKYLRNILFTEPSIKNIPYNHTHELAKFKIEDNEKKYDIEYFVSTPLASLEITKEIQLSEYDLHSLCNVICILDSLKKRLFSLKENSENLNFQRDITKKDLERFKEYLRDVHGASEKDVDNIITDLRKNIINKDLRESLVTHSMNSRRLLKAVQDFFDIERQLSDSYIHMEDIKSTLDTYGNLEEQLDSELAQKGIFKYNVVTNSKNLKNESIPIILFCKTTNKEQLNDLELIIEKLRESVFIAGPPSQPYLFLAPEERKLLFHEDNQYEVTLLSAKKELPGLYIYNQLALHEILEAFNKARHSDWLQAIDSDSYGDSVQKLVQALHGLLGDKKYIYPEHDLKSIIVKYKKDDETSYTLLPEDLSHGELKRIGLYSWIRHGPINNSIVLIDEVENGLHPDWQYSIVHDLLDWGKNQYLLATHSFYLCEALTPKNVKEIEPKMHERK